MARVTFATQIDERIKEAVEASCTARGLKINRFVEEALLDKVEELEDIQFLRSIRREASRPISRLIRDLELDDIL